VVDVQELARARTAEAIAALVEALADPKHKVAAAVALLDRGWGRPTQPLAGDGDAPPVAIAFEWAPALPQPEPTRTIGAENTSGLEDDTGKEIRVVWPSC
jgi:hypothetical protein